MGVTSRDDDVVSTLLDDSMKSSWRASLAGGLPSLASGALSVTDESSASGWMTSDVVSHLTAADGPGWPIVHSKRG